MQPMGPPPGSPGIPDLGVRAANEASKKEQIRILAVNVAMGIEQGRVAVASSQRGDAASGVTAIGDISRLVKDAEAVAKFIDTGH